MLSFFRINDPLRLLILFLAIILVRLPYLISSTPLLYEMEWLTIGLEVAKADVVLYKDFLTPMAPLAALVYAGLSFISSDSNLILQIISIFVLIHQAALFNSIMYKNKAFNESTYIPALVYVLLMHAFFDFFTLSPVLISLTFILLVLDNIYLRIENKLDDFTIMKTGFYMGVAILFYLPSVIFVIATIISFILLTSLIFRRYMLFLYGLIIPFTLVSLYYLWRGAFVEMLNEWVLYTFSFASDNLLNLPSFILIIAVPVLFLFIALYRTFTYPRFTNYQVRVQQVMFIMFLAAWACWLFSNNKAPYQLMIFVPFISFFIAHYLLLLKNRFFAEVSALAFTVLLIGINYYIYQEGSLTRSFGNFYQLKSYPSVYQKWTEGKRTLVLANDKNIYYQGAEVAGKYFDWNLGEAHWTGLNKPEKLVNLYNYFDQYSPETIIDPEGKLDVVFNRLPKVKSRYRRISAHVYVLE